MAIHSCPHWTLLVLLGAGCIFTVAEDEIDSTGTSWGSPVGVGESGPSPAPPAGVTSSSASQDPPPEPTNCINVLGDSGFESGTPNPVWNESSRVFGSPICNRGCSDNPEALPASGDWWVWFGGEAVADVAWVSQNFTLPVGAEASLRFQAAINAAEGPVGDDIVLVEIDGAIVFRLSDADMNGDPGYRPYSVDLQPFADGQRHTLMISAELTGDGLTNVFVDDVRVRSCTVDPQPLPTTDDGADDGGETTSGDPPEEGDESDDGTTGGSMATGSSGGGESGSTGLAGDVSSSGTSTEDGGATGGVDSSTTEDTTGSATSSGTGGVDASTTGSATDGAG